MRERLQVSVIELPGMVWAQLDGDLAVMRPPALDRLMAGPLRSEEFLVLDARRVGFCGPMGVRALLAVLGRWNDLGFPAACLLSPAVEQVARLVGASELLERVEDAALLLEIAAAMVADLQPPTVEWARAGTAAEERSRLGGPDAREHAVIARQHMSAMTEISRQTVATSRLLDARRRSVVSAAQDAVAVCERIRRTRHSPHDTAR
jgi:anti-anti-sigma regulatory factor